MSITPFKGASYTQEIVLQTAAQWEGTPDFYLQAYQVGRESDTGLEKSGPGNWGDLSYNPAGTVESVVAGDGISVDDTDPANPVVSVSGLKIATTTVQTNVATKQALLAAVPVGKVRIVTMVVLRNASIPVDYSGGGAGFGYANPGDWYGGDFFFNLNSNIALYMLVNSVISNGGQSMLGAVGDIFGITFFETGTSATVDIDVHYYDVDA